MSPVLCYSIWFGGPNAQGGATVDTESRDWGDMGWSTHCCTSRQTTKLCTKKRNWRELTSSCATNIRGLNFCKSRHGIWIETGNVRWRMWERMAYHAHHRSWMASQITGALPAVMAAVPRPFYNLRNGTSLVRGVGTDNIHPVRRPVQSQNLSTPITLKSSKINFKKNQKQRKR